LYLLDVRVTCWGDNWEGQARSPCGTYSGIDAGYDTSCAIREDGTVVCWGWYDVEPPDESFIDVAPNGCLRWGILADGTITSWGEDGGCVMTHPEGTFTAISSLNLHVCGLRTDGTVACWGNLDPTSPDGTFVDASAGAASNCGVRTDGSISCWDGKIESPSLPGTFSHVAVGYDHACAIGTDGTISCWGGDNPAEVSPPPGELVAISAGITTPAHSAATSRCGVGETSYSDRAQSRIGAPAVSLHATMRQCATMRRCAEARAALVNRRASSAARALGHRRCECAAMSGNSVLSP
jgi:hypothetical protein